MAARLFRLPRIGDFLCVCCLLCGWTIQFVHPQFDPRLICNYIPGLNEAQRDVCREVPEAIATLTKAEGVIKRECEWQFKNERWNCSGVNPPIFKDPALQGFFPVACTRVECRAKQLGLKTNITVSTETMSFNVRLYDGATLSKINTKESAFVYALTSAVTVHQITKACSSGNLSTCSCDTDLGPSGEGWDWGSCSDDVNYGVSYAQRFLDQREHNENNAPATSNDEVAMKLIHFHNNAVGRRVVQDNMKRTCRCHGFSGSCTLRSCWMELPTIYTVGDSIKEKYDKAIRVTVYTPNFGGSARLHYYDEDTQEYKLPPHSDLVYLQDSEDYCLAKGNYTNKRYCIPKMNMTDPESEYYSPCENFCCTGDFYSEQKTVLRSCNCKFIWCCQVVCQTCTDIVTQFRCAG